MDKRDLEGACSLLTNGEIQEENLMGDVKSAIAAGKAVLGIEFGSTRIKAVLVDEDRKPIASGAHDWENRLENGVWTYTLDDIWTGLQDCYKKMAEDVMEQYGVKVEKLAGIGFSAMMHGYLAFDKDGNLLVPSVHGEIPLPSRHLKP